MATDAERHLLFGLLALQNGLIDQILLVAAFQARTHDRRRSLADHLENLGHLDADARAGVEAMLDLHLRKHGGDPERSLSGSTEVTRRGAWPRSPPAARPTSDSPRWTTRS